MFIHKFGAHCFGISAALVLRVNFMDRQNFEQVIERIEAAAERIAATAMRHERLREEARAALADLDQLILELDR